MSARAAGEARAVAVVDKLRPDPVLMGVHLCNGGRVAAAETPFPSNMTSKDQLASVKHCPSDVTMKELRATGDHLIWGMPSVRTGPGQDALCAQRISSRISSHFRARESAQTRQMYLRAFTCPGQILALLCTHVRTHC